jgi:hypothetical protein
MSIARALRLAVLFCPSAPPSHHRGQGVAKVCPPFHDDVQMTSWAGWVVVGARARAQLLPAALNWSMFQGLNQTCKEIVMECLRDDPAQRAGEDADGSGDAKTGEGILLPDEIVRSLMRAPGINSIDLLQHASEELRGDREE